MNFTCSDQQFPQEGLDTNNIDSLDSDTSRRLFCELLSRRPTFKEALEEVEIQNETFLRKFMVLSGKVLCDSEMKRNGLTNDEIVSIYYFFLDKGEKSIFNLVNDILNNKRNKGNFSTVTKFIFLLLSGLRKLPHFEIPSSQTYYSGIKHELPQTKEGANGYQCYEKGKVATLWGFTLISTNYEDINSSIKDTKDKTIFHIKGKSMWGYDIKHFSQLNGESELILEPEARVLVNDVLTNGICTTINVILQPFDHLVLEDIIPVTNMNTVSCVKNNSTHNFTRKEINENDTFSKSINKEKKDYNIPFNKTDNFTQNGNKDIFRGKSGHSENVCIPDSTLSEANSNTLSFSFSSERFNSNDFEEETTINSIDESSNLFSGLKKKEPSLEGALEFMGYEKYKELTKDFLERGKDKLSELSATRITAEDIAAILCYTFEWNNNAIKKYGDGESPYRKLNNSLSVDRSSKTLKKTRCFLFLLLKALRKLPRFVPENRTLYRGIRFLVQIEPDPKFPNRKPYAAGNEKFWWTFTSTSLSLEATRKFIGENDGSLFMLSGETWGYDISIFSDFPDEKEILLEPERKLSITSVSRDENIIAVNTEILNTPLVLKDIIKVGKTIKIKERKSKHKKIPQNLRTTNITKNTVELVWGAVDKVVSYQVSSRKISSGIFNRNKVNIIKTKETNCVVEDLEHEEEYEFRVRCVFDKEMGKWSEMIVVKVIPFSESSWKECPGYLYNFRKYSVDANNPRIATKNSYDGYHCTAIGNIYIPLNKVTSWHIKILKSRGNDGGRILIGVAPFDINLSNDISDIRGWYFGCYSSTLCSGPPHNYGCNEYGPRKEDGEYICTGDSVGVIMDTTAKGKLSFALNGVNLGVAYEGIPLDKPLVPCVLLYYPNDSVEFDISEVKEIIVDTSVPVPSNVTIKSTTWDSITLSWDAVEGASFYHIEADGSKLWDATTTSTFTKIGFLPESEHSFRVRVAKGSLVSKWSDVVKGKTKKTSFKSSRWKECPEYVDDSMKYSIDEDNPRIATFVGDYCCIIIGSTPLPFNKVTSWNIRILKSTTYDGYSIDIGVAPFDINQNCNLYYYGCYYSALWSEPPHNYYDKEYDPREEEGHYVHTGDSVGVVMDTTKGELSFILNGVNLGVAYEGIPLDKPLVPCVILERKSDSVELGLF